MACPSRLLATLPHRNALASFTLQPPGVLDFHEFQLVVTLLSIPQGDVEVMFDAVDLDGNGGYVGRADCCGMRGRGGHQQACAQGACGIQMLRMHASAKMDWTMCG